MPSVPKNAFNLNEYDSKGVKRDSITKRKVKAYRTKLSSSIKFKFISLHVKKPSTMYVSVYIILKVFLL